MAVEVASSPVIRQRPGEAGLEVGVESGDDLIERAAAKDALRRRKELVGLTEPPSLDLQDLVRAGEGRDVGLH